jgi:hypothetical protein
MMGCRGGVKIVKGYAYTLYTISIRRQQRRFKTPTNQIELEGNCCDRLRGMREKSGDKRKQPAGPECGLMDVCTLFSNNTSF